MAKKNQESRSVMSGDIPKMWRTKKHTIQMLEGLIEPGFTRRHMAPGEIAAVKFALKAVRKADKNLWRVSDER